eukprot:scaffold230257_cov17-Tisochrysis_lutea.AAC.1
MQSSLLMDALKCVFASAPHVCYLIAITYLLSHYLASHASPDLLLQYPQGTTSGQKLTLRKCGILPRSQ